jgi:hypothetical protein
MSLRQQNLGSIIKPGFNPLAQGTPTYLPYLYSWGYNANGQLGLGTRTNYSSPKQVGSLYNWSLIACTQYSFLSIKTDKTLWSWGLNNVGQLGTGNVTSYSSPKQVGALTNWQTIGGGYAHVLAIKTDGTLWAWGYNNYGQLGNGNRTNYSSPIQIGALTNWLQVSGCYRHSLAVKTDGTLWAWGQNSSGQLGLGNTTNYSSPKQVGSLTYWLFAVASNYTGSSLVIKNDGTLWSWGYNGFGQLGLGNRTSYSSPKQIGVLTNWSKLASGAMDPGSVLAVKTDGTLWAWGHNQYGNLGFGNANYYSSPKQVGSLTNWLTVSAGYQTSSAVKTNGTLWTWGRGGNGVLGQGTNANVNSPVQVGALNTWLVTSSNGQSMAGFLY